MPGNTFLSVQWFSSSLISVKFLNSLHFYFLQSIGVTVSLFILNLSCHPYTNLGNLLSELYMETLNFHVFKIKILHISKSGYGHCFLLDIDTNIISILCNFVKTIILFFMGEAIFI